MNDEERKLQLKQVRDDVANLTDSPLYADRIANRYYPVVGEGSHMAGVMFVGEAPGKNEAETGRPFCGAAGKFLDDLLASIGVDRRQVYITNILKDRPPMNRDPFPEEIQLYAPFLDRQIEIIRPKVIVTLGRFSMAYLMEKLGLSGELKPISKMHGRVFVGRAPYGAVKFIPLYHPAVALYTGSLRKVLLDDFKIVKDALSSPAAPGEMPEIKKAPIQKDLFGS